MLTIDLSGLAGNTRKNKPAKLKPAPLATEAVAEFETDLLREYTKLAIQVGVLPPDMAVEKFKAYLRKAEMPVYQLADVIAYMDEIAARESKNKAGWEWRPLRSRDGMINFSMRFGTRARNSGVFQRIVPASDYYEYGTGVYDLPVPLHALQKVAKIEAEFKAATVSFFVSDYALAPQVPAPDPFLMVVVVNRDTEGAVGRFVIDFWDEPGFGIEHMVKTDL